MASVNQLIKDALTTAVGAFMDRLQNYIDSSERLSKDNHGIIRHTSTSDGGTLTANSWRTRPITGMITNGLNMSIGNDKVTLDSGVYWVDGFCCGHSVLAMATRLIDVDHNNPLLETPWYNVGKSNASEANTRCPLNGYFTVPAGGASLEIQHYATKKRSSYGFGVNPHGVDVMFMELHIWKVKEL